MKATIHHATWENEHQTIAIIKEYQIELPKKNRLEFLQNLVGGYIDVYYHKETNRDWVVNDEGLIEGLPLNPWAYAQGLKLAGTIVEIHGVLR